MRLFSKSCPLEKEYINVYGINSPKKWTQKDCAECLYLEKNKCAYKQTISKRESLAQRGQPALVKKHGMSKSPKAREGLEKEAMKLSGLSVQEQKEYWTVSVEYDQLWEVSTTDGRQEILDCLEQVKVNLEKGLSPLQANEKAKEWLQKKKEFQKSDVLP